MNTKSNRKNSAKTSHANKPAIVAPAPVIETPAPAPVIETPAPVVAAVPAATTAEKVSWEDTMKKAQASFAKTGSFREGTNRAILFPLLDRPEGLSLAEASAATLARGGRSRSTSSIHTDLHDIAKITQRKLVRADQGETKRYRLAVVAPVIAEEVK
jgi:hypothetical protein